MGGGLGAGNAICPPRLAPVCGMGQYGSMNGVTLRDRIERLLSETGPLRGADIQARIPEDPLALWRACRTAPALSVMPLGRRFLRLDRCVEGYARLSPSIRREFQTYSIVGRRGQEETMRRMLDEIERRCRRVSEQKARLAETAMEACFSEFRGRPDIAEHVGCILGGDIAYGLAHDVPRPESSTGQLVRGSDLDIIIVTSDEWDSESARRLDDQILKKKHYLLVHPDHREEIDYILKPLQRVREQARFDTFERMVACKILNEGRYLLGSRRVFDEVKRILREARIPERLAALEERAVKERAEAEEHLLAAPESEARRKYLHLFYTREESEEIY